MATDDPTLPRYGDLRLRGITLDELTAALDDPLPDGWSRARDLEESRRGYAPGDRHPAIFTQRGGDDLAAANLYLLERAARDIYVPNVVPVAVGSIDEGQYNALLEHFHDTVLAPVLGTSDAVTVELDIADYDLAKRAGARVADALRSFSISANRSTGASHPSDAQRFDDFVIEVSRLPSEQRPDAGVVGAWLVADGWDEEGAFDLSIQYERGLRLLARLRSRRG